jgi:hypothetical protein
MLLLMLIGILPNQGTMLMLMMLRGVLSRSLSSYFVDLIGGKDLCIKIGESCIPFSSPTAFRVDHQLDLSHRYEDCDYLPDYNRRHLEHSLMATNSVRNYPQAVYAYER